MTLFKFLFFLMALICCCHSIPINVKREVIPMELISSDRHQAMKEKLKPVTLPPVNLSQLMVNSDTHITLPENPPNKDEKKIVLGDVHIRKSQYKASSALFSFPGAGGL